MSVTHFDFSSASTATDDVSDEKRRRIDVMLDRNEKPYECRFCSKKFHKSQALGGHMNRHRQERKEEQLTQAFKLVQQGVVNHLPSLYHNIGCANPPVTTPGLRYESILQTSSVPCTSVVGQLVMPVPQLNTFSCNDLAGDKWHQKHEDLFPNIFSSVSDLAISNSFCNISFKDGNWNISSSNNSIHDTKECSNIPKMDLISPLKHYAEPSSIRKNDDNSFADQFAYTSAIHCVKTSTEADFDWTLDKPSIDFGVCSLPSDLKCSYFSAPDTPVGVDFSRSALYVTLPENKIQQNSDSFSTPFGIDRQIDGNCGFEKHEK